MTTNEMLDELRRVTQGVPAIASPGGIGTVRFIVTCNGDAHEVLRRAKVVLVTILEAGISGWPVDPKTLALPNWFLQRCGPEVSDEEANVDSQTWVDLSSTGQLSRSKTPWSLTDWLTWMNPLDEEGRGWVWWDSVVVDANHIVIAVEVESWPFPWGSLEFLFRASGAVDTNPEP